MKTKLIILAATFVMFVPSVQAQERVSVVYDESPEADSTPDDPERYKDIPDAFKKPLERSVRPDYTAEEFVLSQIAAMRKLAANGETLTIGDIERQNKARQEKLRMERVKDMLKYDTNFDSKVSREEVVAGLKVMWVENGISTPQHDIERITALVMDSDKNRDGIIDYEEMSAKVDLVNAPGKDDVGPAIYFKLEEAMDGQLTIDELSATARKAFSIVDLDKNSVISQDESKAFAKIKQVPVVENDCKINVPADARLAALTISSGAYVPDITTSGQDKAMSATKLSIEPQTKPLQLIFISGGSMILDVMSGSENIDHVYMISADVALNEKSSSAISKLPKEKITFVKRDCVMKLMIVMSLSDKMIAALTGREANVKAIDGFVSNIKILENKIEIKGLGNSNNPPVASPEGYDERLWKKGLKSYPAGILEIDPATLVSESVPDVYDLLPGYFGLAKLTHDGVITPREKEERVFDVVKPIDRFPAGMINREVLKFVLAPGVPIPKNYAGDNCLADKDGPIPTMGGQISPRCRGFTNQ